MGTYLNPNQVNNQQTRNTQLFGNFLNNNPVQAQQQDTPPAATPLDGNSGADLVTGTVKQATSDPVKWAASLGAGAGAAYAIDKGINHLIGSDSFTDSRLMSCVEKTDKVKLGNNPVFKQVGSAFNELKKGLSKVHKLFNKEDSIYERVSTEFVNGTKQNTPLAKHLGATPIRQLQEEFVKHVDGMVKKNPGLKDEIGRIPYTSTIEAYKKGFFSRLRENISNFFHNRKGVAQEKVDELVVKDAKKATQKILENDKLKELLNSSHDPSFNLLRNKVQVLDEISKTNHSGLSKFLAKTGISTGQFIGGNGLGIIMQALCLGSSIKSAMDAPKGEKVSTFMEDFMTNYVGFLLMSGPMTKIIDGVANLRNINIKTKDSLAKKVPLKILKGIGKVLSLGRREASEKGLVKTWPQKIKGVAGGTMRTLILLLVLAPIFQAPFKKLSHMLFGKPSKKDDNATTDNKNNQTNTANSQATTTTQPSAPVTTSIPQQNNPIQASTQNNQQPNSQPQRYIPSPEPANFSNQPTSSLDKVLSRSDKLIDKINNDILGK